MIIGVLKEPAHEARVSIIAEAAAALRANHFKNAKNPVFSDPFAFELTSKGWKKLLTTPLTVKVMNSSVFNRTLGLLTGQVVGRSRYAEDLLQQALLKGTQQYVLVGAGLDSFTLRQAQQYLNLQIFEVDHPDTQAAKQKKLNQFGEIPANVEFVAIDFEKESIADALARSGFKQDQAAFFSWLGTTHYLEPQTTLNTLQSIANIAAAYERQSLQFETLLPQIKAKKKPHVFLSLRAPYDISRYGQYADVVLASYAYNTSEQPTAMGAGNAVYEALAQALLGQYRLTGKLPVTVSGY